MTMHLQILTNVQEIYSNSEGDAGLSGTGYPMHVTTIFCILLMSGIWGRVATRKHFFRMKIQTCLNHPNQVAKLDKGNTF